MIRRQVQTANVSSLTRRSAHSFQVAVGPGRFPAAGRRIALLVLLLTAGAVAQDADVTEHTPEQITRLEAMLAENDAAKLPLPPDPEQRGVFVVADGSAVGRSYLSGLGGKPFLVARLRVVNLTEEAVEFAASSMQLRLDQSTLKHESWPAQPSGSVRIAGLTQPLRDVKTPKTIKVGPGEAVNVFGTFMNLPSGGAIRRLQLEVMGLPQPIRCDLLARAARQLALSTERVGPRRCLALMTIEGRIGTISAHHLVAEIESALADGASRVLIRFGPVAATLQASTRSWLQGATMRTNMSTLGRQSTFPPIPAGVLELHLGPFPMSTTIADRLDPARRLHASDEEAFAGALYSAYQRLPLAEVLADVEGDDPQLRFAALRGGTGRLPERLVPLLLELTKDQSRSVRSAAIAALSDFSSEQAISRLVELAGSEDTRVVRAATRGLAGSRFPASQQALLKLLASVDPEGRKRVARVLIDDPQAEWADLYFQYASKPKSPLALLAMRALRQIGHPDLRDLLAETLEGDNESLRGEAYRQLATSSDPDDQAVALADTLKRIKDTAPTGEMLALLQRVGSREATDDLIRHYHESNDQRRRQLLSAIIKTGDERIVAFLQEQFDPETSELDVRGRSVVLTALQVFNPPNLLELAMQSLDSTEPSMILAAARILQEDGGDQAVRALGDTLLRSSADRKRDNLAATMIRTLGWIATPRARAYLRRIENGESVSRRREATNALQRLFSTSAAIPLTIEARNLRDEGKVAEAERMYNRAIEVDAFVPEIYVQRGHLKSHNKRRPEAILDYDKALEIDPLHPIATSLKAICIVVRGDVDDGLKMVEDNAATFRFDDVYNYNAACAYGQAIKVTPATAENLPRIAEWKKHCLKYLDHCVNELSYDDYDLFKEDPDLEPVRNTKQFQNLLKQLQPTEDEEDPQRPRPAPGTKKEG